MLTGTIPITESEDHWELVITNLLQNIKLNLPVSTFQLPQAREPEESNTGQGYTFSNQDGSYTATMKIKNLAVEENEQH
ncbi:hypothetical protein D3C73_1225050 [compost metagenome]